MSIASRARFTFASFVSLLLIATGALAQNRVDCERDYRPKFGQSGKDVPWEPTNPVMARAMLELAKTTANDRVYDLGAGDGTIVIAAAKQFGATAVGIEYNRDLAEFGQCLIRIEGQANKAKMIAGDIFKTDFSDATVVTMFLWPEVNLRLRPTLLKMRPGTRVVSHMHTMRNWKPDDEIHIDGRHAYLWIIPADVKGKWTFRSAEGADAFTVNLKQEFQQLSGNVASDAKKSKATGSMKGAAIRLDLGDGRTLTGTEDRNRIDAAISGGKSEGRFVGTKS